MKTVRITAVDRMGNAVCAGMDTTVEVDSVADAIADWEDYWDDDERVARGEIIAAFEIVETI